ncbi:MAG: phosphoribosylaminoimidazolesuccinocarboxamide synthase [candidate division WOR-3 bacterium]|nr:phosphoribosylaminoimidazolesuccinocarboxamide synthase [candidate division WOR-3 bacterium]MDW8113619.1 phosphoribosylaminoimidazolesuccinocarboxamide synthase [candidate division WOR-3 bacterium]
MGSVKDLVIIKEPKENKSGIGRFIFSDRYSVFDWGEMPDKIEEKGKAICLVSAYFFEKLEELGIKTHYLGLLEDGEVKKLKDLKRPTNIMEIKLLRVLRPEIKNGEYDYSIYKKEKVNFLIPLEVIYRNSLPEGSSVFKRLKEGSLKLSDLGLKEMPQPGMILENPIIDISTKLEKVDRYINFETAKEIANLSEEELKEIKEKTLFINKLITEETKRIGLFNEDGKFEFGFDEERNLILVDALGTLDECRFTYNQIPISKELARIYYRKTEWYQEVEKAKKIDKINWKSLVKIEPPKLPLEFKKLIEDIYLAYCNELTKREWFPVSPLKELLEKVKNYL